MARRRTCQGDDIGTRVAFHRIGRRIPVVHIGAFVDADRVGAVAPTAWPGNVLIFFVRGARLDADRCRPVTG